MCVCVCVCVCVYVCIGYNPPPSCMVLTITTPDGGVIINAI